MFSKKAYRRYYNNRSILTIVQRVFFVLIMLASLVGSAFANQSPAEKKLEMVKQGLVDLALQSEVRLGSSAYLDGDGILYESSIMSSSADIRGVRVLAYLNEAGFETSSVDAEILPITECAGSGLNIHRQALVRTVMDKSFTGGDYLIGDHYISELLSHSEQTLLEVLAASKDWLSSVDINFRSEYERYMSQRPSDKTNYRFDISIRSAKPIKKNLLAAGFDSSYGLLVWGNPHLTGFEFNQSWPSQALEYNLSLVNRLTGKPVWQKAVPLSYPHADRGYSKDVIPLSVKRQIALISKDMIEEVSQAIGCQTEYYALNAVSGRSDKFKVYVGRAAGVNIGDQFLISSNANILTQALSMSGLAELGLAEVESVTNRTAILRHVAGPKPKGLGGITNSVAIHF